jgi:hypothetical protein
VNVVDQPGVSALHHVSLNFMSLAVISNLDDVPPLFPEYMFVIFFPGNKEDTCVERDS